MAAGTPRVSRLWSATAGSALAVGVVFAALAVSHQISASRPLGEGELFAVEARQAETVLSDPSVAPDLAVRSLRNDLDIAAVSIVDADGAYVASTSPDLVGRTMTSGFLRGAIGSAGMRAVTAVAGAEIAIDGVPTFGAEDVLYQLAQPLPSGGAAVLMYDVVDLTARRANSTGIRAATLQLGVVALAGTIVGIVLLLGRAGAKRRVAAAVAETERMARRATELAEINAHLDEARAQAEAALGLAEEKNRIRSEFVLMINHELRTPLTGVVTAAELLMGDPAMPADERAALLADMVREGDRLRGLISRMLTVARIENRGLGFELRGVPLASIFETVRSTHPSVNVEAPDHAASISTDPDGLVALVSSLADNALAHGASTVTLRLADHLPFEPVAAVGTTPDHAAHLLVVDDGPGIEPSFIPRLFEKFEKSSPSSGTGLGLYLARLMVEALRGSISVATGPSGTTMAVAVPLAPQPVGARP
jgi:two-component system sensor histidine kinase BarA